MTEPINPGVSATPLMIDPVTLPGPTTETENASLGRRSSPGAAVRSARVEVRRLQQIVDSLGVDPERSTHSNRRQLAVVHQPVHRHLRDPHQARHLGDRLALVDLREGRAAWSGGKPRGAARRIRVRGKPLSETVLEDRR